MIEPVRIAMWSGPRNISTALMRSFEARNDTAVVDEPFYAFYLAKTGIEHPLREAVMVSQPQDWRRVTQALLGPVPSQKEIYYQKHMTHHMLAEIDCEWMRRCRNAFLIREPRAVLASYAAKRDTVDLADIGIVRQHELFERECDRLGAIPPVIDGADVLENPRRVLSLLCDGLAIPFQEAMLKWSAGRRSTDGVWASAWYAAVERSTGFEQPTVKPRPVLAAELERIAVAALPHYEALARHRLL